jgi:molybdenum cofactor cytidylyltransferase
MKLIGLIPAGGSSQRMGRPKLTLGLGGESVIQRVVRALEQGGAETVLVVAPPIDQPGAVVLANHARAEGAEVVHLPLPTPDMRATVEAGLDAIIDHALAPDVVLLTPGDVPGLTAELVAQVARAASRHPGKLVVPTHDGHRGHPLALPWSLARGIASLPPGTGVNALLDQHAADRVDLPVAVAAAQAFADMDTPDDYRRWTGR